MKNNFDEIINRYDTTSAKYGDSVYYVDYTKNKKKLLSHKKEPNKDVIPMWLADMDFKPPQPVLDALKRRLECPIFGYSDTPFELIELMIAWNNRRHQWKTEEEWFVTAPSVLPGMVASVLALTKPRDKIIIQSPVYSPFSEVVLGNNRQLVYSPLVLDDTTQSYFIDFTAFETLIEVERVKMFILCSPHNPIGRLWRREELMQLVNICVKHQVFIFSDEIHRDLAMPTFKHYPIAALSAQAAHLTITAIAPNKTFNLAGLPSASLVISNEPIRSKVKHVVDSMMIDQQFPLNLAAAMACYRDGDTWLDELLIYIDTNYKFLVHFISQHQLPIKVSPLEGTYLAWLDCREMTMGHEELTLFFLNEANIWLSDGASFGPGGHGFLRMNLATPLSVIQKALNQINTAIKKL